MMHSLAQPAIMLGLGVAEPEMGVGGRAGQFLQPNEQSGDPPFPNTRFVFYD
jgi:hypothetical protein